MPSMMASRGREGIIVCRVETIPMVVCPVEIASLTLQTDILLTPALQEV